MLNALQNSMMVMPIGQSQKKAKYTPGVMMIMSVTQWREDHTEIVQMVNGLKSALDVILNILLVYCKANV